MFTVCPKCALTLVVTAADLRIAQGYVRCGRCLNVFNALMRLSEERPVAAPPPPSANAPPEPPPADPSLPAGPDAAPAPPPTAADFQDEAIEIELDADLLTGGDPAEPARTLATATHIDESLSVEAASAAAAPEAQPEAAPQPPPPQQTGAPPAPAEVAFDLDTGRPRAGLRWTLGAGALAIALALQIVNHYRDALAASPVLLRPLSAVYSALDMRLAPRWDVRAYEVRQLGAAVSGADSVAIIVRASVSNTASRAQPLPLLRVTLQDRFGNRIAARDVAPRDYLPHSAARGMLLAAGGRVDATMVFVDPGPQAVGFEIDACLPQPQGAVTCAHGP